MIMHPFMFERLSNVQFSCLSATSIVQQQHQLFKFQKLLKYWKVGIQCFYEPRTDYKHHWQLQNISITCCVTLLMNVTLFIFATGMSLQTACLDPNPPPVVGTADMSTSTKPNGPIAGSSNLLVLTLMSASDPVVRTDTVAFAISSACILIFRLHLLVDLSVVYPGHQRFQWCILWKRMVLHNSRWLRFRTWS